MKILFLYLNRFKMFINRHHRDKTLDSQLPMFGVHLLDIDINFDLHRGPSDFFNSSNQFCDGPLRNRFVEISPVDRNRHHLLPAEPCGRDKSDLIHPAEGGTAEKGTMMIGRIGEDSFDNMGLGIFNPFLNVQIFLRTVCGRPSIFRRRRKRG